MEVASEALHVEVVVLDTPSANENLDETVNRTNRPKIPNPHGVLLF